MKLGIQSQPALSPAVEELLEEFGRTSLAPLGRRERVVETSAAALFLIAAVALAVLAPRQQEFSPLLAVGLILAYAVVSRVRMADGSGYTVPTQLVFVPMLFVLPPSLAPLLVAGGMVLGNLPDYLRRDTHPDRAVLSLGDSWHAVAPALVLSLAGGAEPLGDWPLVAAALLAQFGFDFVASVARERLALGIEIVLQPRLLGWVYLVDLLLTPIGLLAAFVALQHPSAFLLTLPLCALLAIFTRERTARIDHARELGRAYRGTTLLLSDVLETDDEYTGMHSQSVVALALAVATEMGLDSAQRRVVEFGALLHDVGKIAVPKDLINKAGPLTEDEWVVMRTHTVEGQRMLDRVGGVLGEVGRVVRASHERWDGGGYPDGLRGEDIPLAASIVSCCDAFNAMTTDRSYRRAMSVEAGIAELRAGAGTQFNPSVVEVAITVIERTRERDAAQVK